MAIFEWSYEISTIFIRVIEIDVKKVKYLAQGHNLLTLHKM